MIPRPTFLMTDPEHFQVAYQINPWMKPAAWSDDPVTHQRAARAGWEALKGALERAGADVRVMGGVAGLPDLVFPANAAIVLDGKALVARFRFPERAPEAPHFHRALDWLRREGVVSEVRDIEGVFQEGAGDCIWDANRRLFWTASGPRSTPDSLKVIEDYFGREVVHMPLATEAYYHLDTCFCPLSGGEILYYPPALTEAAKRALFERTTPDQRIEASAADAEAFCVNAVSLGRKLIMARPPATLHALLAERGYDVAGVDLEPFMLSGGGAFCMTLRLDLVSEAAPAVRSLQTVARI
ncbi:MAG TPA: arginine deiminase-related protein [Caulobacteraceae bacterium]|jgi:N-dimethylarginine dimethylaminohydrolase|nr:arginine deiminase-related protein [Caulobacteraceae bacterium]